MANDSIADTILNGGQEKKENVHLHLLDYDEEYIKELNYYELLGLHPTRCTAYDIKQSYRKACLRYHPDKTGRDAESDYVFLGIKAAYDTLSDPDSRLSYDSTAMPFDDYIPGANETFLTDNTFYDIFGPVFERNLRFDAKILSKQSKNSIAGGGSNHGNKRRNSKNNNNKRGGGKDKPAPTLGDSNTPIDDVHEFYEYWTHFESWRDFSMQAQTELFSENNNPLEDAESRYEKRFYQKEIDKRARQLKKQEMNRIQTLVQRSRNADPRIKKYQLEQAELKKKQAEDKRIAQEKLAAEQKLQREREEKEKQQREEEEKKQKLQMKQQREKEKKLLRKSKQQLRKLSVALYQEQEDQQQYYTSLEQMSDDVEYLCTQLSLEQLNELNQKFDNNSGTRPFIVLQQEVSKYKQVEQQEQEQKEQEKIVMQQKEQQMLEEQQRKKAMENPWNKEELSALAKGVKKFPPGGANRWEQISNFVNNVCRPQIPRTKEECIDKYNQIARGPGNAAQQSSSAPTQTPQSQEQQQSEEDKSAQQQQTQQSKAPSQPQSPPPPSPPQKPVSATPKSTEATRTTPTAKPGKPAVAPSSVTPSPTKQPPSLAGNGSASEKAKKSSSSETGTTKKSTDVAADSAPAKKNNGANGNDNNDTAAPTADSNVWTEEQDKQLQAGLAQYPTSMDKNERWSSISKGVPGKTKKQCVQRFKAIRDAIKNKK